MDDDKKCEICKCYYSVPLTEPPRTMCGECASGITKIQTLYACDNSWQASWKLNSAINEYIEKRRSTANE